MYNTVTAELIKQIPQIGDIDINRLPQELTRIYAQIVSLRRQFVEGAIDFQSEQLKESLRITQTLANNLETILVLNPNHEKKESIAFVAATCHALIQKLISSFVNSPNSILEIDAISTHISSIVLFLIGNSQADAAEIANENLDKKGLGRTKTKLVSYIQALGKGNLSDIVNNPILEEEIENNDLQDYALDYLWRELGEGIYYIALRLTNKDAPLQKINSFDRVIELAVSENIFFAQRSIFAGPYHLAKLLNILGEDILSRGVINIPPPIGVDAILWINFLENLAKDRPYLWENHREAVQTNFLELGISSVLTLPTGAGKSTLSELKIASCIYSDRKVIYLVPTHALEDQVTKNLRKLFPEYIPEVAEFDGEYTEFGNIYSLPILIMTPERCLTLMNISPDLFNSIGLIVFDEFHLINGTNIKKDRRAVDAMYCLISLLTNSENSDFLLVSAMVENGAEIAEWIHSILGRQCKLFSSSWKPTRQLLGCLIFEEKDIILLNETIGKAFRKRVTNAPSTKLKKLMNVTPHCFFSLKNIWESKDNKDYYRIKLIENVLLGINPHWHLTTNRNNIAADLATHFSNLGLKTLVFVDTPTIALSTAKKIDTSLTGRQNSYNDFFESNKPIIESLILELGSIDNSYFNTIKNVGIHHGLLLPIERSLIEQYFKQSTGSISLVATATLAQGINLPAEIVIIAGDDRYDEDLKYRESIPPHELLNAAGRAGRAGQSSQGAVILIPGEIVTIKESTISNRWWALKNEVFSKSDQCLKIEDPMEYFLDSMQDDKEPLDISQTNILYRFKSENLSETETRKLLKNSFYAYKAVKESKEESFNIQVENLIVRRSELDKLSEDIVWTKEISFKTGIDPSLILELGNAIDQENLMEFIDLSIVEYINWFFEWIQKNETYITKLFTKESTLNQIKRTIGIKPETDSVMIILEKLPLLKKVLLEYVQGSSLQSINNTIPGQPDNIYLTKARNFAIRLIPELSFSFGLLTMIILEKTQHAGIEKEDIPWTLKALASCIREGFDKVEKLFFKYNSRIRTRVEAHSKFRKNDEI